MNMSGSIKKIIAIFKSPLFWEINVISLFLVAINFWFWPDDIGYHRTILNPFGFLLLLVAGRYGLSWGLYVFFLGAAYYLAAKSIYIQDEPFILVETALFIFVGLLLGYMQSNYQRKVNELQREQQNHEKLYRELNERYEIAEYLKTNCEKKILTQATSLVELYGDAKNMQVLSEKILYGEILRLVEKYVEAEECSLYIFKDNSFHLIKCAGYEDNEEGPLEVILETDAPYDIVFESRKALSLSRDEYKESITSKIPVYIGPILNEEGEVIGLINVNNIGMLKFNSLSFKIFSLICEWSSMAIQNIMSFKECKARRIINENTKILKYDYLLMRLQEALSNYKVTGTDFSFMVIKVLDWEKVLPENINPTLKFVSRIISQNIRDFDVLTHFKEENEFAVLLQDMPENKLKKITDSIYAQAANYNLKPYKDGTPLRLKIGYIPSLKNIKDVKDIINKAPIGEAEK